MIKLHLRILKQSDVNKVHICGLMRAVFRAKQFKIQWNLQWKPISLTDTLRPAQINEFWRIPKKNKLQKMWMDWEHERWIDGEKSNIFTWFRWITTHLKSKFSAKMQDIHMYRLCEHSSFTFQNIFNFSFSFVNFH